MLLSYMEKWETIKGYNGCYLISDFGNTKSTNKRVIINGKLLTINREKVLTPKKTKNGYLQITIKYESKVKSYLIHRLVAISFIENKLNKKCVNHKDLDKTNNRVTNLEWVTHSENTKHFFINGLPYNRFGKNNGRAKKVIDIKTGIIYETISDALKSINISQPYLSMMLSGKRKNNTNLQWYEQEKLNGVFNLV